MRRQFKFNAFISYLQIPDKPLAIAIRKGLMELGAKRQLLKFRALNIFRDETDLSGIGGLTQRIEFGIQNSEFLILLARPEITIASTDDKINWVRKELEYWLEVFPTKSANDKRKDGLLNIIICLSAGEVKWNTGSGDFEAIPDNCINEVLFGKFKIVPKWVDFREINKKILKDPSHTKTILSLKDPDFLQKVAEVSGQIQDKTVDELIAEDRKRQRMWVAILTFISIILVFLTGVSIFLGMRAYSNQQIAQRETENALKNLKSFKIERFLRDIRNGIIYYDADEPCLAKTTFNDARSTAKEYPTDSTVRKNLVELQAKYNECATKCPQ